MLFTPSTYRKKFRHLILLQYVTQMRFRMQRFMPDLTRNNALKNKKVTTFVMIKELTFRYVYSYIFASVLQHISTKHVYKYI